MSQSKIVTSPTEMIEAQVLHSLLSGITGFPLPFMLPLWLRYTITVSRILRNFPNFTIYESIILIITVVI